MTQPDESAPARPAHVIPVCNLKGGTGKSTLSINLACALTAFGAEVALVDNDEQGSTVAWAASGRLPIRCVHRPLPRPEQLPAWIRDLGELRAGHDLVLVDFPAGMAPALVATLLMASVIIIPCAPNELEIAATRRMMRYLAQVRAERPDDPPAVLVVPNRVVNWGQGVEGFLQRLTALGEELSPPIHLDPAYDDAFVDGLWVGARNPNSSAHYEMDRLAEWICNRLENRLPAPWPPAGSAYARSVQPLRSATAINGHGPAPPPVRADDPAHALAETRAETWVNGETGQEAEPRVIYLDEPSAGRVRNLPLVRWALRLVGAGATSQR